MSRLIDADVLKKDLTRFYENEVTAKQLIDEQPTVEPQRWIPCSERLPKEDKTVLITIAFDNSKYIEFGHIYKRTWEYLAESGSDYWEEVNGVIAWMPLPEPYKPNNFSQHMNPPED